MRNYSGKRTKKWLIEELFNSSSYEEERKTDPAKLKADLESKSYYDLLREYKWYFGEY